MPSSNSVNNVWGSQKHTIELECPSGQVCLVKKPDPQQLVTLGIIEKVDVLSKLVDTKHVKRVKGKPSSTPSTVDVEALSKNPEALKDIIAMSDKVVESVVLEPNVKRPVKIVEGQEIPLLWAEREEDQVYTDLIDFTDRMFIFQHAVGGDVDLTSFREQTIAPLPGVADGGEV